MGRAEQEAATERKRAAYRLGAAMRLRAWKLFAMQGL